MSKETSAAIASIAGRVMGMTEDDFPGNPKRAMDLYSKACRLLADAKSLAASCLAQREPDAQDFDTWEKIGPSSIEEYPDKTYAGYTKVLGGKRHFVLIEHD